MTQGTTNMEMKSNIKILLKNMLSNVGRYLPWGVRQAFLHGMIADDNYNFFRRIAKENNICGLVACGDYGFIQGKLDDASVFLTYARTGKWAEQTTNLFIDFLQSGGSYIDIGGNIGLTTIPIAQNKIIKCIVFEPHPDNYRILAANIFENCKNNNVFLFNLALFDRETTIKLEVSPNNSGDNRIRLSGERGSFGEEKWEIFHAKARRLDDLELEIPEPLVVKIDTQGAEPHIISGGHLTLAKAGLIAIEFWPYGMARLGANPEIVIDFLSQNFHLGALRRGDSDEVVDWRSMREVILQLKEITGRGKMRELGYWDVLAKKR